MKLLKTILSIVILFSLSGCVNEDRADCPTIYNVQLTFSYTGDTNDQTMFAKRIDYVTLFVFNTADGHLVKTQNVNKAELNRLQGALLKLDPGNYRIVCWGNSAIDTEFTLDDYQDSRVSNPHYLTKEIITTESHLYFGELLNIAVLPDKSTSGDVPFKGAHVNIEVYVSGLGSNPVIEMSNLSPQYDFEMHTSAPFTQTYYPVAQYDAAKKLEAAIFQVFRFNDDNLVELRIKNANKELKQTINLKEYMIANDIHIDNIHEATITILIEFTDLGVSVTMPHWESNPVMPGN